MRIRNESCIKKLSPHATLRGRLQARQYLDLSSSALPFWKGRAAASYRRHGSRRDECTGSPALPSGRGAEVDSDGDETDLTGGPYEPPDSPTRTTATITTARCPIDCNVHWNDVEGAAGPCLAAVALLHVARRSVDTSRWWTMRWPQNAVSLVGRAGALSPGKTY